MAQKRSLLGALSDDVRSALDDMMSYPETGRARGISSILDQYGLDAHGIESRYLVHFITVN